MKQIFFVILATLTFINFTPTFAQEKTEKKKVSRAKLKAERKAQEKTFVLNSIKNDDFKIIINRIFPTESQNIPGNNSINRNTSDGYYVELQRDTFSCYLPYIGVSRTAIIGGQDISLKADNQKVTISKDRDKKNESNLYMFRFKNENTSERWRATFEIFDDGTAAIRMDESNRDPISYRGEMVVNLEIDKK